MCVRERFSIVRLHDGRAMQATHCAWLLLRRELLLDSGMHIHIEQG